MGTRLYPVADFATLEALCGAPSGSWEKMEEISQRHGSGLTYEQYEAREAEFSQHHGTGLCYDFALFGWGKLNVSQWDTIKRRHKGDDMYYGMTTDPTFITLLLNAIPDERGGEIAYQLRDKITELRWS